MAVLNRLFLIASLALAANAQFTETYPADGSVPTPKAEWLQLIANANIPNAPLVKANENGKAMNNSSYIVSTDNYCDWSFTGCTRETDIVTCPSGEWGLTYDDGPTEFSPALYDFLDKTQQKATFFLIGGQVVKFPDHAKRLHQSGHELAMHTWSHSYLTTLTNEQIVGELKWNELAIKEATGVTPKFFRPPYGDIDDRVRAIATALGFTPVIWDHDTNDWKVSEDSSFNVDWIDGNVTEWTQTASNGVSLEHDLYQSTVDAAIRILPALQAKYKVMPVGACNGVSPYKDGTVPVVSASASSAAASSSAPVSASAPAATASASVAPSKAVAGNNGKSASASSQPSATGESAASHTVSRTALGGLLITAALSFVFA
ncbi:hypothetical protein BX666DRAFT_2054584 [Dichotomocladium elegans]|nr:hypothetical protein BX666DRAFT_2054584 [Dichotomocladium elegans]